MARNITRRFMTYFDLEMAKRFQEMYGGIIYKTSATYYVEIETTHEEWKQIVKNLDLVKFNNYYKFRSKGKAVA